MALAWGESCLLPWMQPVLATSSTATTLRSWQEQVSDRARHPQPHRPLQGDAHRAAQSRCQLVCAAGGAEVMGPRSQTTTCTGGSGSLPYGWAHGSVPYGQGRGWLAHRPRLPTMHGAGG